MFGLNGELRVELLYTNVRVGACECLVASSTNGASEPVKLILKSASEPLTFRSGTAQLQPLSLRCHCGLNNSAAVDW